jgi:hypothetical protein
MGDSWEDEDEWDAPELNLDLGGASSSGGGGGDFDDEVDEVEIEKVEIAMPSEATLAAKAKKIAEDEKVLQNQVLYALQEGEGAEDRKARERKQVEEADNALTEELMGGGPAKKKPGLSSSSTGIAGIPLNTKAEHISFGITISKKIESSTPISVGAFYKALTERLPAKMSVEVLDDMVDVITRVRDEKKRIEGESLKDKNKQKKEASAKKAIKAKEKKHKEIFGATDQVDEYYEAYGNMEDDFM